MNKIAGLRFYVLIVLLASTFAVKAQMWGVPNLTTFDDRTIHFGFTLGVNTHDLGFLHYGSLNDNPDFDADLLQEIYPEFMSEVDEVGRVIRADVATLIPGFTVGIVSNLRLSENLDLRFLPGLSFGSRQIVFNIPLHDLNEPSNTNSYTLRSTYLDFPLLVKYKSKRIINQRPYMISGLAMRIDISKSAKEDLLRTKRVTFYAEAGMGWDMYLQFFRLSAELKYSFGLNSMLADPPQHPQPKYYSQAFKKLNSHILTLSFHFE
ncbi:MAG: porin family protein [Prolixibacteraceae bacterium]|jgi:hypothetical protein|nr:porin family protein [Prolixibacteraceae bacterium]